ncbi:MAG: CBS domain-containing protein, partial [Thermodesulfobacteriota bacterium]
MQVITTHLNADFDGLASMIGASKLHPEAILAFSGSQEKKLREYIADNLSHQYDFIRLKNIDLAKVTGLIVVDTRVKKRIGPFGKCLDNPGLKLYLYDHHPSTADDMKGDVEEIQLIGSTTTLMTRLLRDRQFEISSGEATLFCLGIYEDTGSLSHLTTKPEDLRQAAWLLEHGAELDVVSQFISYELTGHQVNLLHELMKSTRLYTINNITVVVVTLSLDHYEDDFSLIVRRYMVMENLDNLFALVCMAGRIYLICRSRISEVNVGNIARDMGGGGHATAASATVHGMTIIEAQDKLIRTLHRHMRPSAIAGEMMSKTVITVFQSATIEEAHTLMTRYAINSIPVSDQDKSGGGEPHIKTIKGIVRKIDLERAIRHKLGHLQVSEYMNEDFSVLPKSAALSDIEELIIDRRQRLIPIVHEDVIIGVITRTELLHMQVNDPSHLPKNLHHESNLNIIERVRNLNALIVEVLDRDLIILLRKIGEIAEKLNYQAVAVGGFVRDLLLKQENLDLDIVVDGNGIKFGELLVAQLGGHLRPHERFLTANITLADGFKIDVATARLEYYEYPAALPTVELSSIKLDLYRRDFTINAMALQLNPAVFGTLLDFFGCQADLKDRSIKVLHNLSFVEDPTRIFRAIRFEKRMEFGISAHTSRLIHSAVKMNLFNKVNDPRYFTELKLIFSEENPIPSIMRLADFNLFQFL